MRIKNRMPTSWYYAFDCSNANPNPFVADKVDFRSWKDWDVIAGKAITAWDEDVTFWASTEENDGDPDDVLQHGVVSLPVYSWPLRRAVEDAGISGIQFLPVCVRRHTGSPIDGYSIANITDLLPALDAERSIVTKFGASRPDRIGQVMSIMKPVLKEHVIAGHDVFRISEFKIQYFVSDRFRDTFESNEFKGYTFKEVRLS